MEMKLSVIEETNLQKQSQKHDGRYMLPRASFIVILGDMRSRS